MKKQQPIDVIGSEIRSLINTKNRILSMDSITKAHRVVVRDIDLRLNQLCKKYPEYFI